MLPHPEASRGGGGNLDVVAALVSTYDEGWVGAWLDEWLVAMYDDGDGAR